jgi:hypothetical protein
MSLVPVLVVRTNRDAKAQREGDRGVRGAARDDHD